MRHKFSTERATSVRVACAALLAVALATSAVFGFDNLRHGPDARHQIPVTASAATAAAAPREQLELPRGKVKAGAFRFVALGDMGTGGKGQYQVAQRINVFHDERPFDLALFLGDNVYPSGAPADFERRLMRPYAELIRRQVELRGCLGNHDVRNARGALMQMQLFGMTSRPYHSFAKEGNLIEFFALDSTRLGSTRLGKRGQKDGGEGDEEQLRWLDAALDRSAARWKLVFLHHPLYSSAKRHGHGSQDEGRMRRLRAELEPILIKHKVNAVLSGHDHVYERTKQQQGVQYFVSGAGGKLRRGNINRRSPYYEAGDDQVNSFMFFEVTAERLAFWAVGKDGRVLDSGTLDPTSNAASGVPLNQ